MTKLLSFFGPWIYLVVFAFGVTIGTSATYYLVHTANALTISDLKRQESDQKAANVTASLNQLTGFISDMHISEAGYQANIVGIDAQFATLEGDLKHALAQTPLPVDCRPDDSRMRELTAATRAANTSPAP